MESNLLNYAPPTRRRPRRRLPVRAILACVVAVALLAALALIPVRHTSYRMDAVTGSTERQTTWPFGLASAPTVTASPLEVRLNKMGLQWKRNWRTLTVIDDSAVGRTLGRSCGSAPPVIGLGPVQVQFVAGASDREVRDFVRVLQSGTDAEQRAAVDDAAERALNSLR